jgi:hypothetical protein
MQGPTIDPQHHIGTSLKVARSFWLKVTIL